MRYKFLFSIFVFFFISVFLALGSWQIIRLNWKLELINQIETSLKDIPVNLSNSKHKNYLRIKTRGSIDFEKQIYLYNLNEKGKPGFEVINPLKVGNNNYLLNRGWIPFNKKEDETINVIDENYINGILRKQIKPNMFKPENDLSENYWFTLDRSFSGLNILGLICFLKTPLI